jgi:hypothetical protein
MADDLPGSITTLAALQDDSVKDALPPPVTALALIDNVDTPVASVSSAVALVDRRGDRGRGGRQMVRRTSTTVVQSSIVQRKCCGGMCVKQFSSQQVCDWQAKLRRLDKPDQDQFLFNIARAAGSSHHSYKFLGKPVCRIAIFALTGASSRLKLFRRCILRHNATMPCVDLRLVPKQMRANKMGPKSQDVDGFYD